MTSHCTRVRAAKKEHHRCDFLRLHEPVHRRRLPLATHLGERLPLDLGVARHDIFDPVALDRPWTDRVNTNVLRRDFERERLGEAKDGPFRADVVGAIGQTPTGHVRRGGNDRARLAIEHERQNRSRDQHRSREIDLDCLAPVRERHILDQAVVAVEARIVHEHVDAPAEELGRLGHRFFDSVLVAHVGAEEFDRRLSAGDLSHRYVASWKSRIAMSAPSAAKA